MKTPEEIKKAAACCFDAESCIGCPYSKERCIDITTSIELIEDMRALIEQQEEQIMCMKIQMHGDCGVCKHRHNAQVTPAGPRFSGPCYTCMQKESRPNWEYEGLPELPKKGASHAEDH